MFAFFDWLTNLIASLASFLVQMVLGLFRLLSLIPSAVTVLTNAVGFLPSLLSTFAAATITICVVFIIVGRDEGGQK